MHLQTSINDSQVRITSPPLSEDTIPSVLGEWYNYRSVFTPARPLGYLMKCRANKDRTLHFVEQNVDVDLTFVFDTDGVQICSPDSLPSLVLMEDFAVDVDALKRTAVVQTTITVEQFNAIRDSKDRTSLVSSCRSGAVVNCLMITLGMIIAVTTPTGKYCLMRAIEVGPDTVRFDACHILL